MLRLSLIVIAGIAFSAPAFAQRGKDLPRPPSKMTYGKCLQVKQSQGLPAARAARVCEAITKSR